MGILFGTDGVRGIANLELTPEMAFDLGRAGSFILAQQDSNSRPRIMVGKDTRVSGDMLEAALLAGICSTGADALTLGVIPTPAVAYLTQQYNASLWGGYLCLSQSGSGQWHQIFSVPMAINCQMKRKRR